MAYIGKINVGGTSYDVVDSGNIAVVESSNTATRRYYIGDYVICDGTLYRVTTTINSGETISSGVNVTRKQVCDEIKTIRQNITSINNEIAQSQIKFKTGTITITGGTVSSPETTEIDISSLSPGSQYSPWAAFLQVGSYAIPYMGANGVYTRISSISSSKITIMNAASAYTSLTYYLTVIYKLS